MALSQEDYEQLLDQVKQERRSDWDHLFSDRHNPGLWVEWDEHDDALFLCDSMVHECIDNDSADQFRERVHDWMDMLMTGNPNPAKQGKE